ncbi:MAG: hypothetical protein ABI034_02725 [Nakamurella sp.]
MTTQGESPDEAGRVSVSPPAAGSVIAGAVAEGAVIDGSVVAGAVAVRAVIGDGTGSGAGLLTVPVCHAAG